MAMDLRKYNHKVRCEMAGCRNMAIRSIGEETQPINRFLICDECLQKLTMIIPKDMILKRADIVEIAEEVLGKPEEEIEDNMDYDNMNMVQLRKVAKAKGKPIPVGFTREEAVTLVKNLSNWKE